MQLLFLAALVAGGYLLYEAVAGSESDATRSETAVQSGDEGPDSKHSACA